MKSRNRKIFSFSIIVVFLISILSGGVWFLIRSQYPKIIKSLPDPFIFNNETRVSTQHEWEMRREEIKILIQEKQYGTIPKRPDRISASRLKSESMENGTKDTVKLKITPFNSTP